MILYVIIEDDGSLLDICTEKVFKKKFKNYLFRGTRDWYYRFMVYKVILVKGEKESKEIITPQSLFDKGW